MYLIGTSSTFLLLLKLQGTETPFLICPIKDQVRCYFDNSGGCRKIIAELSGRESFKSKFVPPLHTLMPRRAKLQNCYF